MIVTRKLNDVQMNINTQCSAQCSLGLNSQPNHISHQDSLKTSRRAPRSCWNRPDQLAAFSHLHHQFPWRWSCRMMPKIPNSFTSLLKLQEYCGKPEFLQMAKWKKFMSTFSALLNTTATPSELNRKVQLFTRIGPHCPNTLAAGQVGMIIQLCWILFGSIIWSFHTHQVFPEHFLWIISLLAVWKVNANDQRNLAKSRHKHTQTLITHTHTHQTKRSCLHSSVRKPCCVCVSCRWTSKLTRAFIWEHVRSAALPNTHSPQRTTHSKH